MTTAQIDLSFSWSPELPNVLSVQMPSGFAPGDNGDIYLDEHDGTRFASLWPAIKALFPKGATADSNGKDESWISSWNDDALKAFDNKRFSILLTQGEDKDGDFNEAVELVA
jgi:hypothetical protein